MLEDMDQMISSVGSVGPGMLAPPFLSLIYLVCKLLFVSTYCCLVSPTKLENSLIIYDSLYDR